MHSPLSPQNSKWSHTSSTTVELICMPSEEVEEIAALFAAVERAVTAGRHSSFDASDSEENEEERMEELRVAVEEVGCLVKKLSVRAQQQHRLLFLALQRQADSGAAHTAEEVEEVRRWAREEVEEIERGVTEVEEGLAEAEKVAA
eukprot:2952561-Rhodomonas_salina.1